MVKVGNGIVLFEAVDEVSSAIIFLSVYLFNQQQYLDFW
jgi:hypothetical protein